ncbi:MAG: 4Fe-4S binding protein [Coriobacteriales bacterium]|nr:4Fe-4S binding protein [Coriobacteriales bacterium]
MALINIDTQRCDRSPACPAVRVCPRGAIRPVAGGGYPGANGYEVVQELCSGCGICARACPGGAVMAK